MFWLVMVSSNNSDDGLQGPYSTVGEAAEDRCIAAQVVVDNTGALVEDDTWLWDWERLAEDESYAWRFIHSGGTWHPRHSQFGTSNWGRSEMARPPGFYRNGR